VLFHAAETNQKQAMEILLRHGADPEIANYAGTTPAMAAQGRSHTAVARLLARAIDDDDKVEPNVEGEDPSEVCNNLFLNI
jgi:ankyrin repeat protein